MKRIVLMIFLITVGSTSYSQIIVDGVDLDNVDVRYIEVIAILKMSGKTVIAIDYGQKMKFSNDQRVEDRNGKDITFHSVIQAINFMDKNGWEYLNNYPVSGVYHYLFKRKSSIKPI